MIIIQNLILCINEKITLPRIGFKPVTVLCLKNDTDFAKMNLSLWHRAIEPAGVKECLDMIKYYSKGCWSPTPLAVNKLGNLWQWIGLKHVLRLSASRHSENPVFARLIDKAYHLQNSGKKNQNQISKKGSRQGRLKIWTKHSHWFSLSLKPFEIS